MKKLTLIKDLLSGSTVTDVFLLTSATQGQAKNGPYWRLELRDASGSISGKVWSPLSLEYTEMPVGEFLHISARVSSYRDKLELAVIGIEVLSAKEQEALSLADFVPSSPYNPATMMQELKNLCKKELQYQPWHDFVFGILEDEEIAKKLLVFPAAKSMHHAYAGGLLEHTLSVCRICLMLSDHYPWLDRQLLIAGAICHDLGKIWELTSGLTIDYTDEGRLIGHIALVMEHIKPFISSAKLDDVLALHLHHLILSHHGTLEFGSPKLPSTPEAMMLHYADNIDAKMQQMRTALAPVGDAAGWSSYVPALERFLYQAEPTPHYRMENRGGESFISPNTEQYDEKIQASDLSFEVLEKTCVTSSPEELEEVCVTPTPYESIPDTILTSYSDTLDNSLQNEDIPIFDSYLDPTPIEDNRFDHADIPSVLYDEVSCAPEERDDSIQKEDSSCVMKDSGSSYGDNNSHKEIMSIPNDEEQNITAHDLASPNKKSVSDTDRIYDNQTHDLETSKRGGLQKTSKPFFEGSDNLDKSGNGESADTKENNVTREDNSDLPHKQRELDTPDNSLPLDGVLIAEKLEDNLREKSILSPQALSLLDHCL